VNRRDFLVAAATTSAAFARPAAAARLGGTPLALVTADLESRVLALNPVNGRIVKTIRTQAGPRSIESVGGKFAVVAHSTDATVSVIDVLKLEVRHVLDDVDEPRYTAAYPNGRLAFVTDSGAGGLLVVDLVRGQILARVLLGGPARHLGLSPRGRVLWVALGTKAERVAVVDVGDPRRPEVVAVFRPPFLAHDIGFARGGKRVWVTSGDQKRMALYDPRRREVLRMLDAGSPPQHVTFCGGRAQVSSGDDGTLTVHRLGDGRALRMTRIPAGSYNVQQGWGRVFTPSLSQGTLCALDEHGRLLLNVRAARSSHDACFVVSV
jgi:DNA-binding beta-propeller fold protein YncE